MLSIRSCAFVLATSFGMQQICAKAPADTVSIKKQLDFIYDRDQKCRTGRDSAQYMDYIDSTNLVAVDALISKYGWPGKSFVGPHGNTAVFLVIQHADSATQVKYLPIMQRSVEQGESSKTDFAMLQDRVLMWQGKKQIYGSQVVRDNATGNWILYPIEDEEHVNERRAALGLEPIEEYAKFFGIEYKGPAKR